MFPKPFGESSENHLVPYINNDVDTRKTTNSGLECAARWLMITSPLKIVHPWKQITLIRTFQLSLSVNSGTEYCEYVPESRQALHLHVKPGQIEVSPKLFPKHTQIYKSTIS